MDNLGKYEIVEKIGEGGFGAVYKARDPHLKRTVALKTCTHDDEGIKRRFLREGEIVASLQHPNITLIHDLGFEGGTPFLVQEFLTGEDLAAVIGRRDPLDDETRFGWLIGIARGLEYAHGQGIIHRDIKPANIRILADRTPKIMDFGIAKLTQDETRLTRTGSAMGTIAYMSPEQLDGSQVDHRSDIFAFGALAYELFAYERPFDGETTSRIVYQILHEDPRRIEAVSPEFGPGLDQVLRRCLAKKPASRFQGCGEVAAALERLRSGRPPIDEKTSAGWVTTDAPPADPSRTELLDPSAMADLAARDVAGSVSATQAAPRKGSKRGLALGIATPLALAAFVAYLLLGREAKPPASVLASASDDDPTATTALSSNPPAIPSAASSVDGMAAPAAAPAKPAPAEPGPASRPAETAAPESSIVVSSLIEGAERAAREAQSVAERAGARQLAPVAFAEGARRFAEGRTALGGRRVEAALEAFLGASEAFDRAANEAIVAAQAAQVAAAPAPAPSAPTVVAAEPKPTAPPPSTAPDPQSEIQRLLDAYVAAYEGLDSGAVVAAVPSLQGRRSELDRAFGQYRSLDVSLTGCRFDISGERASTTCDKRQTFELKVGQGRSMDSRVTFRLARRAGRWTIDSVDG